MKATELRLSFVGMGNMAGALCRAWLAEGLVSAQAVRAAEVVAERRRWAEDELSIRATESIASAVTDADVVVIAVKPQQVHDVLPEVKSALAPGALVISILAGVPLSVLQAHLGNAPLIRVMPNTPCLVNAAASGLACGEYTTQEQQDLALRLFQAVGTAFLLPEALLDAVTGLSGSGPANVYLVIEALTQGGVQAGLPVNVAKTLAAETLLGAAKMVLETGNNPAALREAVTSPAGTTAAGLLELEKGAVRGAFIQAVLAATRRSKELGGAC